MMPEGNSSVIYDLGQTYRNAWHASYIEGLVGLVVATADDSFRWPMHDDTANRNLPFAQSYFRLLKEDESGRGPD